MKNLLEQFLDEIDVRYNRSFADKLYYEHPHRYNMYGLKKMLDVYGVRTVGVRIESKDFSKLNYPCILHTHGDFAIGVDCTDKKITYILHNRKAEATLAEFEQTWTGNALVVEETTEAVEPDFERHRREEWLSMAKTCCIPSLLIIAAIIGFARNVGIMNLYHIANIFMSSVGVIVCALLMQKQLYGESHYGDKVCSLFHHVDCNSILDGPKAKVFGISWSEVGMGFFVANILLLSLYPKAVGVISVINWMAMLYGFWSIYYQWRIAKNWCVLCVIVQTIVWVTGSVAIISCLNEPFGLNLVACIYACMAYAMSIMSVHLHAALHAAERERIQAVQQYKAIKANGSVAKTLIEQGKYYETSIHDSSIVFGNPEAKLRVTILSNPHCNPCARMHKRVEKLLHVSGGDVSVQYIFPHLIRNLRTAVRILFPVSLIMTRKRLCTNLTYGTQKKSMITRRSWQRTRQVYVETW